MKNKSNLLLILTTLFLSLGSICLEAQNQIVFHTDKPYYITGETAWYELHLPISFKDRDLAFRVVITDPGDRIIEEYFLKNNGTASLEGYYNIPFSLLSGVYQINFFVSKESGQEEKIFSSFDLHIYNDLNPGTPPVSAGETGTDPSFKMGNLNVSIRPDKTVYNLRNEVALTISVTDKNGNPVNSKLSISVFDNKIVGESNHDLTAQSSVMDSEIKPDELSNTVYHKGRITGDNGEPLLGNVIGAYSSLQNQMFYTKSKTNGEFILSLPDYYGTKPIQLIGYIFEEHASINIARNQSLPNSVKSKLTYSEDVLKYLEESRKRKKIYQYYKQPESTLLVSAIKRVVTELKPDGTYNIKEYEDFKNFAEFFNEIIDSQLNFPKKKDGTFSARMYNPEGRGNIRHFTGDPIFIIDGKITRDANYIGNLSLDAVESVDLYFLTNSIRDDFGTFGNSAFVLIHTSLPEVEIPESEQEDIFVVSGIQPAGSYLPVPAMTSNSKQPVFRPQIFWGNNVLTNNEGNAEVRFLQSDDASSFKVVVVAQSTSGDMGRGEVVYEVSLSK